MAYRSATPGQPAGRVGGRTYGDTSSLLSFLYGGAQFYYNPGDRVDVSFSRSSDAAYRDDGRVLKTAGSGGLRDQHYIKDEDGIWRRATRLEAARTNSLTRSEEFGHADWTKTGLSVTADNASAPDGATTADRLDGTSASDHVDQTVTVSDDSNDRAVSVFLKKSESTQVRLEMGYTGGTTEITEHIDLDTSDGSVTKSGGETRSGVEDWNADWYRLWLVVSNNGSGNTTLAFRVFPDQSGNNVNQHAWGAQLEGLSGGAVFPSSYIQTTSSAVSRAADDLSFPISFGPQSLTIYQKVRLISDLSGPDGNERLLEVGATAASTHGHLLIDPQGGIRAGSRDGSGSFNLTSAVAGSAVVGDIVEVRMAWNRGTDYTVGASVSGGSESTASVAEGAGISAFGENKMAVGRREFLDHISLAIAPGVRTMSEMRSLA